MISFLFISIHPSSFSFIFSSLSYFFFHENLFSDLIAQEQIIIQIKDYPAQLWVSNVLYFAWSVN